MNEGRKFKDNHNKRPDKLSTDKSLTIDAILHVISSINIKKKIIFLSFNLLPFRPIEEIKEIFKLYFNARERNFKSLFL